MKPLSLSLLLGKKVRSLRLQRGDSLKELAARAEISRRFLVEIESGRANPSLARLGSLAKALRMDLGELCTLSPASPPHRRIALAGLRGAGKSTLGKLLAKRLGMAFVELDVLIQEDAGISVSEIFELEGPDGYRRRESLALEQWLQSSPEEGVLAVPGGIVHSPSTWERLLGECHTVWLRARPEEHWDRVAAQGDTRPMAGDPGAMDRLRALLNERTPAYRRAEFHLDTRGRRVESCLEELERTLKRIS